jgi:hypothetical protein
MFCIRTFDQFSWSDGGYGMQMILNGEDSGNMTFQFANAGFNGTTAPAITNFNSSGGNISYSAAYDTVLMQFFCDGNELTNGLVYHCAFSLNTDTNGLTTATVYLAQGTGALGPGDIQGWATFNILSSNLLNWSGVHTDQCFTNQPWNFGVGWANNSHVFVADYASPRSYNSAPASFTALPAPLKFLPPVVSSGQITLNWTGSGRLQWAPALEGPWSFITPAPASGYSQPLGVNQFYRLLAY